MTLERERIERLAIDRALGALGDDVDALLSAYLAHDPAASRAVATLNDVAQLARRALAHREQRGETDVAPLPPFPAGRLRGTRRGRSRVTRLTTTAAAMAACLLVGSLLGAALARRAGVSPAPVQVARQVPQPSPANETPAARAADAGPLFGGRRRDAGGSDLWSTRRLVAHAESRQGRSSPSPTLRWISPAGLHLKEEQR